MLKIKSSSIIIIIIIIMIDDDDDDDDDDEYIPERWVIIFKALRYFVVRASSTSVLVMRSYKK